MTEIATLDAGDGHSLTAHFSTPSGRARGAIVVVQEIFGVNGHIQSVCDRFASDGWVAVAPALFDRVEHSVELDYDEDGAAEGRRLKGGIGLEEALTDIAASAEAAAAEVGGPERVGVVGYCWGGSLAAAASVFLGHMLGAAVGYYGSHVVDLVGQTPQAPLLLHFGELDAGVPPADVEVIRAAWPDVPIHVHPGAQRGFNCDQSASFHQTAAAAALETTFQFLSSHLD